MFSLFVALTVFAAVAGETCDPTADQRIVKGEYADEGEFPFMASLRDVDTGRHYCGGSIITKNWLLTAAHCCWGAQNRGIFTKTYIRAGSIYANFGGTNHTIEDIIPHETSFSIVNNDICLIRVRDPFVFDKNVQQVILPKHDYQVNSGDQLTAVGWGWTKCDGVGATRLMKLETFNGLTNAECEEESWTTLFPGIICARPGKRGQGICFGDSGGPLLKNDVLVGISSFIYLPCGNPSPDFFARVSHYYYWIKDTLGPYADDLKFSE